MPITSISRLFELAEPQHGYFTAEQAKNAGFRANAIVKMAKRGIVERISQGVYRVIHFPVFQHGQLMEASLWPLQGVRGVISHDTALSFLGASDVSPAKVHITVPKAYRIRRRIPPVLVVHHDDLAPEDFEIRDGIAVTTARRAILDCHASHLSPLLVHQAIVDGESKGLLTKREAKELTDTLVRDPAAKRSLPAEP